MDNPFSNLEDEKLMELYINGESMAFEVLYLRHKDKVYSYLSKRIFEKNLVDDIFQNTFVKFHKSRNLYDPKYPVLKWLYTICRSELLDSFKKKKVTLVELNEAIINENLTTNNESQDILDLDSEKSLTQKERDALKLRYFSEEDFKEISQRLGTSEANSRKIISRGIQKLRMKYLGEKS